MRSDHRDFVRAEKRLRGLLSVFLARYGSAPSCIALEQMMEAGIRRLIVFGEAGSIHPGVKIGDIVLSSWGDQGG